MRNKLEALLDRILTVAKKRYAKSPDRTMIQLIIDESRKVWMSSPQKHKAVAKQAKRTRLPGGRFKTLIRCADCQSLFCRPETEVNHIIPVGTPKSTETNDLLAYLLRMFCKASMLEVLCVPCHRKKTAEQRK